MRRFKFTLSSVLMLKDKALQDERLKLSEIANLLNKQKSNLEEQQKKLYELKNNSNSFLENSFNPVLISNYGSYILKVENEIQNLKNTIKRIEIDFLNQKEQVKKAYIELKTVEKLKEKQLEKYNKELLQEEIKIIDDIVISHQSQKSFASV